MAESSFRKGFGAGCGFIAAALFVFVVLPLGACIVFGVYGSFDRAVERATGRAALSAACTVSASEGQCVFTNTGDDAGASCVTVVLRHRESGESIASQPTCSGEVAGRDTVTRPVVFVDREPRELCGGSIERSCEMDIVPFDGRAPVSAPSASADATRPVLPGDPLDPAAREVIGAASSDIARCLRPGAAVTVRVTVGPSGAVEEIDAASDDGPNACVAAVVRGLAFAPREHTTHYVFDLGARPSAP